MFKLDIFSVASLVVIFSFSLNSLASFDYGPGAEYLDYEFDQKQAQLAVDCAGDLDFRPVLGFRFLVQNRHDENMILGYNKLSVFANEHEVPKLRYAVKVENGTCNQVKTTGLRRIKRLGMARGKSFGTANKVLFYCHKEMQRIKSLGLSIEYKDAASRDIMGKDGPVRAERVINYLVFKPGQTRAAGGLSVLSTFDYGIMDDNDYVHDRCVLTVD